MLAAQAPDLSSLEKKAEAEFQARNCTAAGKTYSEALAAAQAAGENARTILYYLRLGNCRARGGDLSGALEVYIRATAVAEASGESEQLELALHGTALTLAKLGRIDDALPVGQREYELTEKCGHPAHLVRAMWLVGGQYEAIGRVREGLAMMNRALATSRTLPDLAVTEVILESVSNTYVALGDLDTALSMEQEILAMPEAPLKSMATTYSRAVTWNNLAEIQLRAGRRAEARKSFERAVAESRNADEWHVHLIALFNLADMQNDAGEYAKADEGFQQALDSAVRVKIPDLECAVRQIWSDALLTRGDLKGALAAGAEALTIARRLASPDRVYKALLSLGAAQSASGDSQQAKTSFDEALQVAETLRAQSPGEASDLRGEFANLIPLYQASVRNLIRLGQPVEALQRAEQAKARVLMDIMLRGGTNERAVMTHAESIQQDALRKRLADANAAVSAASSPTTLRKLQSVMIEFRQFRRAVYENHPELAVQSADFEAAGAAKLGTLVSASHTAMLDYFFVPNGVAVFVVRGSGDASQPKITVHLLPDAKHTLAAEAREFRAQLAGRDLGFKPAAQHLFSRLLTPVLNDLRGTTEWIVSPDGALWDVPFEALVDPTGHHVVETRAVTLVPSLTAASWIHERNLAATPGGLQLLALGNPLPSASPLPDAALEVAAIGANFAASSRLVLTGAAATAEQFREKSPGAQVIHLAAHAGLNNSDPMASYIRLGADSAADGMVTAQDIMSLHLRADLVVLSACETARGATGPGEGMIGMGWALAAAGASSSVLSYWKVDSVASRAFMTAFYKKFAGAGKSSKASALRQSALAMLKSVNYRHPFYWAAFALWGDGGLSAN